MKKAGYFTFIILFTLGLLSCSKGAEKSSRGKAGIEFDTIKHNFGEVPYKGNGEVEFIFTNNGTAPLLVSHVKSTCGCTVPVWSRKPIKAGRHGTIHVSYDTHRVGSFNKSIYVYSNAANGVQCLTITGKISPALIK